MALELGAETPLAGNRIFANKAVVVARKVKDGESEARGAMPQS